MEIGTMVKCKFKHKSLMAVNMWSGSPPSRKWMPIRTMSGIVQKMKEVDNNIENWMNSSLLLFFSFVFPRFFLICRWCCVDKFVFECFNMDPCVEVVWKRDSCFSRSLRTLRGSFLFCWGISLSCWGNSLSCWGIYLSCWGSYIYCSWIYILFLFIYKIFW